MEQHVSSTRRLGVATLTAALCLAWLVTGTTPAAAFGSSEPPPLPAVNAGGYMTCGVTEDGTAVCWGQDEAPGDANTAPGMATPPADVAFQVVNTGYGTACGVTTDNAVVCWGNDRFGKVSEVPEGTYTHVVPGLNYVCALRTDGTIACWGGDDPAAPGADPDQLVVADVPEGEFTQVTVGIRHACALGTDNTITCWGFNLDGQIAVPEGSYTHVNAGNFTTCAIRTDGTAVCWGRNQGGQHSVPEATFTQISAGFAHVCGLQPDGTILCWGRNNEGQATPPAGTFTNVSTGTFHSCAMPTSGPPAVCWGNNQGGRVQPSMSATPPPDGSVGTAYSHQLTMETHVSPAPEFSVVEGNLPPGVELSADGLLSGTPTEAGSYTVTVAASNALSPPDCPVGATGSLPCTPDDPDSVATATRVFTIVITPAEPGALAGQVTDADTGAAIAGATVTATFGDGEHAGEATTDGDGNYTISDLPARDYTVTATADGYQTGTQDATVVAGETTTANFALTAGEDPLACGDVITEDTVLESDLGPCTDDGLVVGADDITLDLGGHRIFGTDEVGDGAGVLIDGRTGVTVRNGTISDFDGGVAVDGGEGNHLEDLVIENNIGSPATTWGEGVAFWESDNNTVCNSIIRNNGPYGGVGVYGEGTTGNVIGDPACGPGSLPGVNEAGEGGNLITGNNAEFNADVNQNDGVRLEPDTANTTVENNVVEGSGLDGIAIFSRSTDNVVRGNIVRDNGAHDKLHRFGSGIIAFAGSARNLIEDNTSTGNAANGIVLRGPAGDVPGSMDNEVLNNTALNNAVMQHEDPGAPFFDLHDANFEPPCDNNTWLGNVFETFNQECVTAGGVQAPAITGRVTDAETGAPIAGATVTAVDSDGGETTTTTDDDGTFTLQGLTPGEFTLIADADGYEPASTTVTVEDAQVTTVDLALEPEVVDPEPTDPTTKNDCKKGGWRDYGFRNQGQCIRYVNTGKDSRT